MFGVCVCVSVCLSFCVSLCVYLSVSVFVFLSLWCVSVCGCVRAHVRHGKCMAEDNLVEPTLSSLLYVVLEIEFGLSASTLPSEPSRRPSSSVANREFFSGVRAPYQDTQCVGFISSDVPFVEHGDEFNLKLGNTQGPSFPAVDVFRVSFNTDRS